MLLFFYKDKNPVRLMVINKNTDIDKCIKIALTQHFENETLQVLYDNLQNSFHYFVENVYEVNNSDFSPIYDYDKNGMFLTLITCNNVNNNRIIVRACAK